MHIQILGAHNLESGGSRYASLLVDGVLAIDAGALASGLSLSEHQKLEAILLTHQHYDHVRDVPAIGMSFLLQRGNIDVYTTAAVRESLATNLLNDKLYPNFTARPPDNPAMRIHIVEPGSTKQIGDYSVLAVPVNHSVPGVGYQVTAADGKAVFYTGDTGPGLAECWQKISPGLLIIEATVPNSYREFAERAGHLTPALLQKELESFREIKGFLPPVVAVHMCPLDEREIEEELDVVAKSLNTDIQPGYEGMHIDL